MAVERDPFIGRLVAGQFRIGSHLGTGAMATIYRARDEKSAKDVALKIIKPDIVRNKTASARFHREAKAASKLQHAGIVAIDAWGFDDDLAYIAMELVEGEDLFELLDRRGALSEEDALHVAIALCDALGVAHEQGIVHRDLKPENIMVGGLEAGDPRSIHIKVLDFGIAKLLGPQSGDMWGDETVPQALTKVGSAVGTPSHMAPEQARGEAVDGRTDIYAVGVLLYEMVTGHLPFEGDNPLHVAIRQVREAPPPPSTHNADLHPELEAIILKMLEKAPASRYQSVAELEDALGDVLSQINPDHQTAQRAIPADDPDDVATAQRDIPAELVDDPDFEMLTAQREIPASLRNLAFKRKAPADDDGPPTEDRPGAGGDDDDPLTNVVRTDELDEPLTMELDTVAGKTMRRHVEQKLLAARAAVDAASTEPASEEVTTHNHTVVDEASLGDRTPFVGRTKLPRPRSAGSDGVSPELSGDEQAPLPEPPRPTDFDIEDEDSEEVIPTMVADPAQMSGDAANIVMQARAAAEADAVARRGGADADGRGTRQPALSITKPSDFTGLGLVGGAAPAVEVVAAASEVFTPPALGVESPESRIRRPAKTANLPAGTWNALGPNTRGAANELEDLLKQMPHQRQPIVGSIVVLVFLAAAIVALVYLLVGAATY